MADLVDLSLARSCMLGPGESLITTSICCNIVFLLHTHANLVLPYLQLRTEYSVIELKSL
jgi:hypothetical protein